MTASNRAAPEAGFTLLEIIIVIVLMAIAVVGVGSMQRSLFSGESSIADVQARSRLLAECGEQIWAIRRRAQDGYAQITDSTLNLYGTNKCGSVTTFPTYAIPTVGATTYTGLACPAGAACQQVQISQGSMTPLTVLMIDY
jgi:prepilin-type N-terminal cleavage/methylation domain-containing protein